MAERIDAHHHVWDLDVRSQGWTTNFPAIDRTFTIDEFLPQLRACGIDGAILVETINVEKETAELLDLAARHDEIRGVVGWVDLTADDVADRIARLRQHPGGHALVGLRHQVQGESDPEWLARPDVVRGLRDVAAVGLVFELLVRPEQLPAAVTAVGQVPAGRFTLTHLGKPDIASGMTEPWDTHLGELAAHGNVACKLSGLVTEAGTSWTVSDLEVYAARALALFGPDRVMAGSDWPVCLLAADYARVWQVTGELLVSLSPDERDAVLGGTATTWYGLS